MKTAWIALLVVVAGCGGSRGMRPDGGGTAGQGGGGSGGSPGGTTIARDVYLGFNRDVDILFLVDDSTQMVLAQNTLRDSFTSFAAALRNLEGGLPNIHIGVVSSDMGAGTGISNCSGFGKNGILQFTPRGTCTATNLQAGATFISDVGGVKNYTGNLEDVLACITALGESGCGLEQQFAAIVRALGADGFAAPVENQGFLRPDAYLAIVILSNEDDCSAQNGANSELFISTNPNTLANPLGPVSSFRCNEFGHICDGSPPARLSPTGAVTATRDYQSCVPAEEAGRLQPVANTAAQIKALKVDPDNQIIVAAITGPKTPYQVHWAAATPADTGPWPVVTHSCTASNGSFGDPGVRTAALVEAFGDNGLLSSICDASFTTVLERLAAKIGDATGGPCIAEPIADDPARAGFQPQCNVEMLVGDRIQPVPSCADNGGAAPCWSLLAAGASCQRPKVTLAPGSTAMWAHFECAVSLEPAGGGRDGGTSQGTIGAQCNLGVVFDGGPGGISIATSPAPDCASGICLFPGATKDPRGTGPLCTASCTTNADCAGGVLGNLNDPNDHRCKTGFACAVETTVGDLCCRPMCVCRDFVTVPPGGFQTPAFCMPGSGTVCPNQL